MYNEMMDTIGLVNTVDPELAAAMDRELNRQRQNIELIASENIVSPAVMAAMGSILTNKYAEGLPGKRYYGGCVYVDEVENIAIERACKLFGAKYANVQPHSGAQANLAVYFALLDLGDTVMGMDLSQGGHLTHGSPVNMSGKNYNFVSYGVNADGVIDYAELEKQVKKVRPKLIVAGASAYPRAIDFEKIAEIAHGYGAYLMVDMAHIAGLVAGGYHQSPVPYADVVTTTTHKTLRGPRGGLILTNNPILAKRINSAVFPGTQGGPLEHVIAAKAVCFGEALKPEFKEYARKIVENAQALAAELQARGVKLVSGGTDNHLMLIDLRDEECTGKDLEEFRIDGRVIPCHLIDILDPDQEFNVFEFQKRFYEIFSALREKKVLPLLVGGTGLYLESVLTRYVLPEAEPDERIREELAGLTMGELQEMLLAMKPQLHNQTDLHDRERLVRKIEIEKARQNPSKSQTRFPQIQIGRAHV